MDFSPLLDDFFVTTGALQFIRVILASILIFILPGFAWTLVLFHKLSIPERIVLSFGLSIATGTLSILVLNLLLGLKINFLNTVIVIIVITLIPLAIYFFRRYRAKKAGMIGED